MPINTHVRHRPGTDSHGHNSLLQVAHNSSGSIPKCLSGYSQGRLMATLSAHSGLLTVFGTQPLKTSRLISVRHTETTALGSKHPTLPRTLLRTDELCSLAFVMPLTLGSILCHTPHSSPFSFEAVEPMLPLTLSRRQLGQQHCSPRGQAQNILHCSFDLQVCDSTL